MVAANLVREATTPITLYIIDEAASPRGVAYGTENPEHLLNVRAGNMSAWAEDKNHLIQWLKSDAGKYAAAARGVRTDYTAQDFIPRALYGDYLESIWRETQEMAAQKNCSIKMVPSHAVAIQEGETPAILTARGDAIAMDHIVLAVGHEVKPVLTQLEAGRVIQNPWGENALAAAKDWASPVLLIGSGLTAVDVLISLRREGYAGEIIAASMNGQLPRAHAGGVQQYAIDAVVMAQQKTLSQWMRWMRDEIRTAGDWRAVVDALRPHTIGFWQRLSTADKQRFLRRLNTFWMVHRHRMSPEITARLDTEIAAGKLRVIRSKSIVGGEGKSITISSLHGEETFTPSAIINCTGFELNLAKSTNPLLRNLLAQSMVEPHETGLGLVADPQYRAWGALYPKLSVIGSLLTGQLLESTAVPELRAQASAIAKSILA